MATSPVGDATDVIASATVEASAFELPFFGSLDGIVFAVRKTEPDLRTNQRNVSALVQGRAELALKVSASAWSSQNVLLTSTRSSRTRLTSTRRPASR